MSPFCLARVMFVFVSILMGFLLSRIPDAIFGNKEICVDIVCRLCFLGGFIGDSIALIIYITHKQV